MEKNTKTNVYNPKENEKDLTIFRNINTINSPLPTNTGQSYKYDMGFWSDVIDEWNLSWIGQVKDNAGTSNEWFDKGFDENYDPFAPENLDGFEEYADQFVEILNQEHHQVVKDQISKNLERRQRLEGSDRGLTSGLVAGIGDPINWIPIPFVKGIGFGSRMVKGGLVAAGLVGATEPIRRKLDLTSTSQETGMYIGGAFLLGGILSGAFGRRIAQDTIKGKGGIKKMQENYFKAWSKTEGRPDYEVDGFNWKIQDDAHNATVEIGPTKSTTGKKYNPVVFSGVKGKYKMVVDELHIRNLYNQGKHLISDIITANPIAKEMFRTADDFMKFLMKKEVFKKLYTPRKKGETIGEYENRLNSEVLADLKKSQAVDRSTETNRVLEWVESWTNYGTVAKLSRLLKNPNLAKTMQELSGDFGTGMRGNRVGVNTANSAWVEANTKWFSELRVVLLSVDQDFVAYRNAGSASNTVLDMNLSKGAMQTKDALENLSRKIQRRNDPNDPNKLTKNQFYHKVTNAVVDPKVYNDPALHPVIKQAADRVRKFYKTYGDEAEQLHMFASHGSYRRHMEIKLGIINDIKDAIPNAKNVSQRKRLEDLLQREEAKYKEIDKDLRELTEGRSPEFETNETYLNRIWNIEKILKDPEAFKKVLKDWFKRNPLRRTTKDGKEIEAKTDDISLNKRVDEAFDNILNIEASQMDGDGFGGWAISNGVLKAGAKPLMHRKINIPNREVMDWIETDINFLMRQYHTKMAPAIEIARKFGDKHLDNELARMELMLIKKHLNNKKDNTTIDKLLNAFEDEKDKLLGTLNLQDPASLSKRSAAFLKDWASLAFMGKVIFSAMVDVARPVMVNGFHKTFAHGRFRTFTKNIALYDKAIAEIKYLAPASEIVMGNSRKRYIEDGGQIGLGRGGFFNKIFDRVATGANKAQGPFYIANLLSPWTVMWKDFQGIISAHRLLEDSIKVSMGVADDFDIRRLASYGIDEKAAKLIAKMPYEKVDDLLVPNTTAWHKINGGSQAIHKFRQALFGDVQRTIITPSPADQFNLMHGVFRVNDDALARSFDNSLGRFFGFQKTTRGGKFSNAWMGLPFQFFSWAVAANRKLLISGLQGREVQVMGGALAMVTMGMMGDYMKNPRYWSQKSTEEKLIRGVELSGIAGLFTDMNFMMETISGGFFDNPMGIRPMLGQELRFGDPDAADAIGEFTGAGPSIPIDLLYAFGFDQDYDDKAATLRRIMPLNTLWIWDRTFKNLWDKGAEFIK